MLQEKQTLKDSNVSHQKRPISEEFSIPWAYFQDKKSNEELKCHDDFVTYLKRFSNN